MGGRAINAGLLYCALILALGFWLGLVRTVLIAPLAGEPAAVALEAPVMLAASWGACGWVLDRLEVPPRFLDRLVMGGVALAVLILAEAAVAILAQGLPLLVFLRTYSGTGLLLGLLVQLAFAFFPLVQRRSAN